MSFSKDAPNSSSLRTTERSKADVFNFFVANLELACKNANVDTIPKLAHAAKNVFQNTIGYSLDSENLKIIKENNQKLKLNLQKMENTARSYINRNDKNRHLDYYPLPLPEDFY